MSAYEQDCRLIQDSFGIPGAAAKAMSLAADRHIDIEEAVSILATVVRVQRRVT